MGGAVVVPVAEIEGEAFLVVDIAVLRILHRSVFPDQVLPVDARQALLGLVQRQDAVMLPEVSPRAARKARRLQNVR